MGAIDRRLTTSLSVTDCATVFRAEAGAPLLGHGRIAKLMSKAPGTAKTEFFTPTSAPFGALDDDPPEFSLGAKLNESMGVLLAVHLYVYERSANRQVDLYFPSGGAKSLVGRFVAAFERADPTCSIN